MGILKKETPGGMPGVSSFGPTVGFPIYFFLKIPLYFSSRSAADILVWQYRPQELCIFGLPVFSSTPYCNVFDGGIASKVWLGTEPAAIVYGRWQAAQDATS